MIYIIIGTRGQFIKMFPLMQLLDKDKINYQFVSTDQHYQFIEAHAQRFQVRPPDIHLTYKKKDLANIGEMVRWFPRVLFNARSLPIKKNDYVVVHGNAESALLGFLIGKYFGAKIIHIEAGVRSNNFLAPFPEELIEYFVSRFANVCFCPTKRNAQNLKGKKNVYLTSGNTVFDAVRYCIKLKPFRRIIKLKEEKYTLFLVRRNENLFFRKRVELVLDILEMILKKNFKVIWPMQANTKYNLIAKGVWPRILQLERSYSLKTRKLFDYVDFMHLIKNSQFVAADGAGVQNETYFLNRPLLILREATGNLAGLGETAYLSFFKQERINYFLNNYSRFKRRREIKSQPSKIIAGFFKKNH